MESYSFSDSTVDPVICCEPKRHMYTLTVEPAWFYATPQITETTSVYLLLMQCWLSNRCFPKSSNTISVKNKICEYWIKAKAQRAHFKNSSVIEDVHFRPSPTAATSSAHTLGRQQQQQQQHCLGVVDPVPLKCFSGVKQSPDLLWIISTKKIKKDKETFPNMYTLKTSLCLDSSERGVQGGVSAQYVW